MNRTKMQRGNTFAQYSNIEDWISFKLDPWLFVPNAVEMDGSTYPPNNLRDSLLHQDIRPLGPSLLPQKPDECECYFNTFPGRSHVSVS
jgi:hypothetical protein